VVIKERYSNGISVLRRKDMKENWNDIKMIYKNRKTTYNRSVRKDDKLF